MPAEDRAAISAFQAKGREGGRRAAGPEPDLQSPAGEQIENGGVLGHPDRIFERQRNDTGSKTDARRLRGDMGKENQGRRKAAFVRVEMVLRDPGRVEAETLGGDDLLLCVMVASSSSRVKKPRRLRGVVSIMVGPVCSPLLQAAARRLRPGMALISSRV